MSEWIRNNGGEMPIVTVHNGRVCVQLYDNKRGSWCYIPLKRWETMNNDKRKRYSA